MSEIKCVEMLANDGKDGLKMVCTCGWESEVGYDYLGTVKVWQAEEHLKSAHGAKTVIRTEPVPEDYPEDSSEREILFGGGKVSALDKTAPLHPPPSPVI